MPCFAGELEARSRSKHFLSLTGCLSRADPCASLAGLRRASRRSVACVHDTRLDHPALLFAKAREMTPGYIKRRNIMDKKKPTQRIAFARIIGTDDQGNEKLGSAREIGAIWPRGNGKGGILRLDHIPVELTRHEGVLFVSDVS